MPPKRNKPLLGVRQAAMAASAKRHQEQDADKQSKARKVNTSEIADKDGATNVDVHDADMTNYRDHLKHLFCKGKQSAKYVHTTSSLSAKAGAHGISDFANAGQAGRRPNNLARDMLHKKEKGSKNASPN